MLWVLAGTLASKRKHDVREALAGILSTLKEEE
jgi:hypothetical protein